MTAWFSFKFGGFAPFKHASKAYLHDENKQNDTKANHSNRLTDGMSFANKLKLCYLPSKFKSGGASEQANECKQKINLFPQFRVVRCVL